VWRESIPDVSSAKSLQELDIYDAAIKRLYLINWHLSPEEFDRLPQRYPMIWRRINMEDKRKRDTQNG